MSTKHKKNRKPIAIFVNGFKIILSQQYSTKWEDVLKKVATVLQPRFLVKRIVSQDTGFIIRNVADFEPYGKYIACGPTPSIQNKFKRHVLSETSNATNKPSSVSHTKSNSRNLRDKNCTIYVFANGEYKYLKKFVFSQNSYFSWDFILGSIDIGFQSNFASLYTLYGQKLLFPRQLKSGSYYVAVGPKENFCRLLYLQNYKTFKKMKEKIAKEHNSTYGSVKSLVDSLAGFLNTNITCYSVHNSITGMKKSKEKLQMSSSKNLIKSDKKKQSNNKLSKNANASSVCFNKESCKKQSKSNSNTGKFIPQINKSEQFTKNQEQKVLQSNLNQQSNSNLTQSSSAIKNNSEEQTNETCDTLEKSSNQTSYYSTTVTGNDTSTSYTEETGTKIADGVKNQIEKAKGKAPSFAEPFYVATKTEEKTLVEQQPFASIKIVKTEISVQTEPIIRKSATTITGTKSLEINSERRPTYSDIFHLVESKPATPPTNNTNGSFSSSVVSYPNTNVQENWNRRSSKPDNTKPPKKKSFFAKCFGC